MEYRTVEGVELVSVGMSWLASSGPVTLTFEHLDDMVAAANDDPLILAPRLKIGHLDPRFNEGPDFDPYDGTPAFGKAVDLRLENDGATVVADFVEVPEWLADAMPSAYPSRSCEWIWDHTTEGGRNYTAVLTAVSLLGDELPAVADLEDLERLLTEGPDMSEVTDGDLAKAAVAAAASPRVAAAADVDKVISTFYTEYAQDEVDGDAVGRYWWWVRTVWTDPNEIIADTDTGSLMRVPFSSDDEGAVTFGEAVEVRQTFVDVASGEPVAATKRQGRPQAVFASRSADGLPRREKPDPAASRPQAQEDHMSLDMDALRDRLGLSDDATEEQINEALKAAPETPEGGEGKGEPEGQGAATPEGEPEAVAASRGVTLDKDAHAQLKSEAAEGRTARQEQLSRSRADFLDKAVKAGKFPPASKEAYRKQLDQGGEVEASTRKFIDELEANTVPVSETGEAGREDAVAASAGLPDAWLPNRNRAGTGVEED